MEYVVNMEKLRFVDGRPLFLSVFLSSVMCFAPGAELLACLPPSSIQPPPPPPPPPAVHIPSAAARGRSFGWRMWQKIQVQ